MNSDNNDNTQKEFKSKYSKGQRILAIIGLIVLAIGYVLTIVSAVLNTPWAKTMFLMCIFATIFLPFMIYGYAVLAGIAKKSKED